MNDSDELLQRLDRDSTKTTEAVKAMLMEAGRPDLAADLERKLRDIRLGIDGAQRTWAALSTPQTNAMKIMAEGRKLHREPHSTWYVGIGRPAACGRVCRQPTIRNLIARELVDLEGGAFDPEAIVMLSDKGRFVLKHGPNAMI